MPSADLQSASKLLKRLRAALEEPKQRPQLPPRAFQHQNSTMCDALENSSLSLRARALLALLLSRQTGFTLARSALDAIDDRMTVYAALCELEREGFVRCTTEGWEVFSTPTLDSADS